MGRFRCGERKRDALFLTSWFPSALLVYSLIVTLRLIGEHPLARDSRGNLVSRIATAFLHSRALVTIPGSHATQRAAYTLILDRERIQSGLPPLTEDERNREWQQSVDLIMDPTAVLIRPDPDSMGMAFDADELLHEIVSKRQVRFLYVMDRQVLQAIKQRGEYWRISPLPRTADDMTQMIEASRISIACLPIYYYNMVTGVRYLTCDVFARLAELDPLILGPQLQEIREFSCVRNRLNHPEIDFFMADSSFGADDLQDYEFYRLTPEELRSAHAELSRRFAAAVPAALRTDAPTSTEWRNRMFSTLIQKGNETVSDEVLQGISPEFFLQIQWLPGGRIEDGELLFDPVFDELDQNPGDPELRALCDEKARGFIFNFIRELSDVEYVNVGRVFSSLSLRPKADGRRDVYIAEVKQRGRERAIVRIIRMQKWGIREHLNQNEDLLQSIMDTEEYTEYILDRRLGCRQLGMNLSPSIVARRIAERYHGPRQQFEGRSIWATYFERDYIAGIATDKIPAAKYRLPGYAIRFARLMGRAAAPNMLVGRMNIDHHVLFDDGDEVIIEDTSGLPADLILADHTGTFTDYQTPLISFAHDYARPIRDRLAHVDDGDAFIDAYLRSFIQQFEHTQEDYRKRRRAFDTLFKHRPRDEGGSFAYRWECVLRRLDSSDPHAIADAIRRRLA